MKKVVFVEANDIHLKNENIDVVMDLIVQMCDLADKVGCDDLLMLGDIFDARPAQKQGVLIAFNNILDYIGSRNKTVHIISGNHDKSNYLSHDSYLTPYENHPAINLINTPKYLKNKGASFDMYFIPYYDENKMWIKEYEALISEHPIAEKSILFSHIAVTGSVNNDGTTIENSLSPLLFKDFFKVFLGHYHNFSQVGKNIFHLQSPYQTSFGEDNQKGFTLIYSDGSHEFVKSKFKEYKTITVDVDSLTSKEIKELSKSEGNIRIEIKGDKNKIDALNLSPLKNSGIKVVKKDTELEIKDIDDVGEIIIHNKDSVIKEFKDWCEDEQIEDSGTGLKYIK